MLKQLHANGKILLTGEYFVLNGAESLVLPLKIGQVLNIHEPGCDKEILVNWTAKQYGEDWFTAKYGKDLSISESTDHGKAAFLQDIFMKIAERDNQIFSGGNTYKLSTNLEFDRRWGLGSSSTLLWLLSKWSGVDPYYLHFHTSNGSGYDIAAAEATGPFIYSVEEQRPCVKDAVIGQAISRNFYFVYLGRKQISSAEVEKYLHRGSPPPKLVRKISALSNKLSEAGSVPEVEDILEEHEQILARYLAVKTVKQLFFSDWKGTVKSLGAWGGDFVLFIHQGEKEELVDYLQTKSLKTCLSYNEIIAGNL